MGMSIDEAISDLIELKICVVPFTKGTMSGGSYKVITGDCLDEAIDTMRKYQKIQEIIKSELCFDNPNFSVENLLGLSRALEIFKEIEDGNVD